jgi:hypothetical protein
MQDKIQEKVQQGWRIQEHLGRIALSLRFVVILYSVLRILTVFRDPDLQNFP